MKTERNKIFREKGITLVALVITIIIIIILATITLNMAFGDNGLITKAEEAKDMTANSIASEQEEMNSLLEEYSNIMSGENEIEEPNPPDPLPDGTIIFGEVTWSNGQASVTVSTSESGYTIQYQVGGTEEEKWSEISNGGTVGSLKHGDMVYARITDGEQASQAQHIQINDTAKPVVTVTSGGATSNSVKVNVTAIDNESGMVDSPTYTYSIKQSSQDDSSYETPSNASNVTTNTYTFTGLTQGTSYDIKVEVNGDEAGNIGIGYLTNQETEEIPDGIEKGAITFGSVIWSGGKASVTVNTNTSYTIQYQVNSTTGTWNTIENGGTVDNLNHNDTVYARLYDGNNYGDYASVTIKDTTPPTISNIATSVTENSITVNVTASDSQSGIATYTYALAGGETTSNATGSYTFTGLNASTGYTIQVTVTDRAGQTAQDSTQATTSAPPDYVDSVLPNAPKLSDGMTPVKWNGSNWIKTTTTDSGWYNYANKQWANVVLGDATFNGSTLDESKPYSMLVWIPRYAYQITSQYHQSGSGAGNINIVFIDTANKNKAGTTTYSETYPSYSTGSGMSNYVVHPAFNYGGTKLPGFWIGKFETSNTQETSGNSTTYIPMIKAGVTSWRSITISNIFTVCTNMNSSGNPYELNTSDSVVDPHMMKNSEWGAVAYLSQNTTYGKGNEVWINNSSTYITGNAGNRENAGSSSGVTNSYDEGNGPQASTTGNVTGVYDMSGGAWEFVAGYVNNGHGNLSSYGSILVSATDKYKDVYRSATSSGSDTQSTDYNYTQPTQGLGQPTLTSGRYGDAVWETSSGYSGVLSWYSDYCEFPFYSSPFFARGGNSDSKDDAGVFNFRCTNGDWGGYYSFRVVIPVLT